MKAEREKSEKYLTNLKYLQADFENYRKRMRKEMEMIIERSNEKLITDLLIILDDLERTIKISEKTEDVKKLAEGVKMIHNKLYTILSREGLTEIEALGKPFNPHLHEVLAKVPTDKYEEGTIIEEARKGFIFKDKVIRPSIVKIACKMEEMKENE